MKGALLLTLALLVAAPGLAQRAVAQQQQVLRELQLSVQRLAVRIDAVEQRQNNLSTRLAAIERGAGDSDLATKDEVAALRADLAALRSSQEAMRGEIVNDLSGRMAKLSERQAKAAEAAAKAAAAQSRGSGYSHVVESGQTLSAIAQAYGVPVRTIMRANKITDPSKLQVGQKLFIPDP